jgi:hypothetical protein
MHTVSARLSGIRRLIGENSRGWSINRIARPAAVVQIPHAIERKFDNKRDAKFDAPPMALFGL